MRKFALLLLLAGTAAPALAADGPFDNVRERAERRTERTNNDGDRQPRSEPREERRERVFEPRVQRTDDGAGEERSFRRQLRDRVQVQDTAPVAQPVVVAPTRDVRRGDGDRTIRERLNEAVNGTYVPRDRDVRPVPGTVTVPTRDRVGRGGRDGHRWTHDWRGDRRYDWRRHRDRHRSTFRIGFYYDPFGWSYRRYGIGSYLYPNYYRSSFWINDPWQYRLPPAYGPYRWVRYYNDALLVDTWTGEVVDVIHGFFW